MSERLRIINLDQIQSIIDSYEKRLSLAVRDEHFATASEYSIKIEELENLLELFSSSEKTREIITKVYEEGEDHDYHRKKVSDKENYVKNLIKE